MGIVYNEENRTITLHTRCSTYQMKADELGILLHTYYGPRIDETDMSYRIQYQDRGFSGNPYEKGKTDKTYSVDVLPQEYSCFGSGDFRATGLHLLEQNGARVCDLRYKSHAILPGKYSLEGLPASHGSDQNADTLKVCLEDSASGLCVELLYGVFEELDMITRAARLVNNGEFDLCLEKAASISLDFQFGEYDWITFYGGHVKERQLQRNRVHHGIQSIGSVRGASSHHYNPFSILCTPDTTETSGTCYGFSFLYSGEFLMEVEKDQVSQTRIICGIHPDNFLWKLAPGEAFQTPETVLCCSCEGFSTLSRRFHRFIRENICRGEWTTKQRPVLINNWEATYFDFTGEKLISIAKAAKELGIDLFVLDDGWFGKRDDDHSGLGDWFPNEDKLGCSLKELAEKITEDGMLFGIWYEPEAISEDSELFQKHPEWAVQVDGRTPCLARDQLILDFSRKDVQDYILEQMSNTLSTVPISYVKWDMNRNICDKFSHALDAADQGRFSHLYILGLYRVLEELHTRFPHILFEGCSGGGGRFDAGMLYYTPQIWCSDNTDAINRLDIQYGTSFGYPVSTMGAHVSAVPNHQTGRSTPLDTRGCVAMAGTFGYELDLTKLTDEEKDRIKVQICQFREDYDLLQYGDYYRLTPAKSGCVVWEFASPDGTRALVNAVFRDVQANDFPVNVPVYGLQSDLHYKVELIGSFDGADDGARPLCGDISGHALEYGGITLPPAIRDYHCWQVRITRC